MTEPTSDDKQEEYLDKRYPFIDQGAQPPGQFVDRVWQGQLGWRTRHGQAVVRWDVGRPSAASAVLFPDGSRGDVGHTFDFGYRRHSVGPTRWIYGTIDVRPDDVVFTDAVQQPTYTPPAIDDIPNLEAELARDDAFLASIEDDRFAKAVNHVFSNRVFYKGNDERPWTCGQRQAARLVRDLRGMGESYQDYYPWSEISGTWPDDRTGREATLRKMVADALQPSEMPSFDTLWQKTLERRRSLAKRNPNVAAWTSEQELAAKHVTQVQFESTRAELERRRPDLEAQRLKRLASAERALSDFLRNENADVFDELRAHLTRLGWRTENADDRARASRKAMEIRVSVMRDVKALEARMKSLTPDWAQRVAASAKQTKPATILQPVDAFDRMTEEEREASWPPGALYARLVELAINGQIAKEEFDALQARLHGRSGR